MEDDLPLAGADRHKEDNDSAKSTLTNCFAMMIFQTKEEMKKRVYLHLSLIARGSHGVLTRMLQRVPAQSGARHQYLGAEFRDIAKLFRDIPKLKISNWRAKAIVGEMDASIKRRLRGPIEAFSLPPCLPN